MVLTVGLSSSFGQKGYGVVAHISLAFCEDLGPPAIREIRLEQP